MALIEFNSLDQMEQLEMTWEKGTLEDSVGDSRHYYLLYRLYDFFVEIAFNAHTDNVIYLKSFS